MRHGHQLHSSVALVWLGAVTEIMPAQEQEHCEESSRAATPPMVTVAEPGVHGDRTGMQG